MPSYLSPFAYAGAARWGTPQTPLIPDPRSLSPAFRDDAVRRPEERMGMPRRFVIGRLVFPHTAHWPAPAHTQSQEPNDAFNRYSVLHAEGRNQVACPFAEKAR